jgi:putative methyltransferase (TIGR04325 family)
MSSNRRIIGVIKGVAPVRALLRARYARVFRTADGLNAWHGTFGSFAEAIAAAPRGLPVGYDNPGAATMYDDSVYHVGAKDYPVLYWLIRVLEPNWTLMDFGGHTGSLYSAYHRYLPDDSALHWMVYDVPAVAELGASRAHSRGDTRLSFTSDFNRASESDVILASGSLQYVETPFSEMLRGLDRMPRHLIVNKLPTQEQREIITLQNIGVAYCAYRLVAHHEFTASIEAVGYTLVDAWINPEDRTRVPYNDNASPVTWRGYYFRRR